MKQKKNWASTVWLHSDSPTDFMLHSCNGAPHCCHAWAALQFFSAFAVQLNMSDVLETWRKSLLPPGRICFCGLCRHLVHLQRTAFCFSIINITEVFGDVSVYRDLTGSMFWSASLHTVWKRCHMQSNPNFYQMDRRRYLPFFSFRLLNPLKIGIK